MRSEKLYLQDIVDAVDSIGAFLRGISEAEFLTNELIQSAVLQKLMIIGEASARISRKLRSERPEIPWTQVIGFRNIAVHAYFVVDYKIVWNTATSDAPQLREKVQAILNERSKNE